MGPLGPGMSKSKILYGVNITINYAIIQMRGRLLDENKIAWNYDGTL